MYLKLSLFFFLLINISGYISYSQNEVYQSIKELELSDTAKAFKIDSLLINNVENGDSLNASIVSSRFANWHYNRNRVAQAVAALSFSIQYHTQDTLSLAEKWYRKGYFNLRQGDYYSSIYDFEKVIKIAPNTQRGILAYVQKADALYTIGDFELAATQLEIAEKALLDKKDYKSLIYLYTLSYNTYSELQTEPASKKLLRNLIQADSLSTQLSINSFSEIFDIKVALGKYFTQYKYRDITKGKKYLIEAYSIAKQLSDSSKITNVLIDLGRLYDEIEPLKSIDYYKKASKYCTKEDTYLQSIIKANLGITQAHLGDYEKSIDYSKDALVLITGERVETLTTSNKKTWVQNNIKDDNFWVILRNIAETYAKKADQKLLSEKDIDSAQTYYRLTDMAFQEYQKISSLQNSKFLWRKQAAELYSRALRSSFLINDSKSAYELMEKNKALILTEERYRRRLAQQNKLPKHIFLKEQQLQFKINRLKNESQNDLMLLKSLIDSLQQLQNQITTSLPKENNQLEIQITSLEDIQKGMQKDEALIQYHIAVDDGFGIYPNPNTGYGLFISKDSTHFFELQNLKSLKADVDQLTLLNSTPFRNKRDTESYRDLSYNLFHRLIPDLIQEELANKSITIIPDFYLAQLPFESLMTSPDGAMEDYFIFHNDIHYKYSYSFHNSVKGVRADKKKDFIAYAPLTFPELNLPTLSSSEKEINALDYYLGGELRTDQEATKNHFITNAGSSHILHLATHANASDSIPPWISFKNEKISLDEISLTETNADLVVLSACNTTKGEALPGEGVMSLARGFFYGGSQSTISSLWQVDDKATTYIMEQFYRYLSDGKDTSQALHRAKLDYLQNHNGSELSPYYWSSFILIGNNDAIDFKTSVWLYVLGIALLFFIAFFVLSRKRKAIH